MTLQTEMKSDSHHRKSIEELENDREWWWVAEKKRSERLDYLRKAV